MGVLEKKGMAHIASRNHTGRSRRSEVCYKLHLPWPQTEQDK